RETARRLCPAARWLLGIAGASCRAAKPVSKTTRRPPRKGRGQKYRLLMERRHLNLRNGTHRNMRFMKTTVYLQIIAILASLFVSTPNAFAQAKPATKAESDAETAKAEQSAIGVDSSKKIEATHTLHPDAQWYPDAGLGLFLHWGVASVRAMNISWPMRPGRALAKAKLTPEERERVIR